jgi:hypothetical protein
MSELAVRPFVVETDLADAHAWVRQLQGAGGEILGVEKFDSESYMIRALVPTQHGLSSEGGKLPKE